MWWQRVCVLRFRTIRPLVPSWQFFFWSTSPLTQGLAKGYPHRHAHILFYYSDIIRRKNVGVRKDCSDHMREELTCRLADSGDLITKPDPPTSFHSLDCESIHQRVSRETQPHGVSYEGIHVSDSHVFWISIFIPLHVAKTHHELDINPGRHSPYHTRAARSSQSHQNMSAQQNLLLLFSGYPLPRLIFSKYS